MVASCPSLRCSCRKKNLSHAGKQSGRGVVVSKICYNALIVLSVVLCDCCKRMNDCRDWAFSNIGLEEWLPAFQLLIFENKSINAEKRYVRNVCLGNPCLLWNLSLHSLPEACGSWELQYTPPALHSWLHHAHPFVAAAEKKTCLMQRSRGFGHGSCGIQDLDYNGLIVPLWLLQRKVLASVGLEVGLPAFQLPIFSKCEVMPKGDLWDMLVGFRH